VAKRVLVVDDLAEMRAVLSRVLSGAGYQVDVAATLAQAMSMSPGQYDAVIVDAGLGPDRGTDLIEALRSQDEAAAARCLIITGGALDKVPVGIASLAKPFDLDDLLDAVRALAQAGGTAPGPAARPAGAGSRLSAAVLPAGPAVIGSQAGQLLRIIRRLRERERRELADLLHDGPIQELAAASLQLQLIHRSAAPPSVDAVQQQVDTASGALRWLVDEPWPVPAAGTGLAEAVRRRTAWLLAAPATVESEVCPAGLGAAEEPLIADLVELLLLATEAAAPAARAHVVVRADHEMIEIDLALMPAPADHAVGDSATAQAALDETAAALGADMDTELSGRPWRVRLAVRKRTAS
jgi:DNA-binding response OmpR family regulator